MGLIVAAADAININIYEFFCRIYYVGRSKERSDMHKTISVIGWLVTILCLTACDPNSKPAYGESTGLPANCRAYVQVAVDAYHNKEYTADETMAGLERNCGANGHLWDQK